MGSWISRPLFVGVGETRQLALESQRWVCVHVLVTRGPCASLETGEAAPNERSGLICDVRQPVSRILSSTSPVADERGGTAIYLGPPSPTASSSLPASLGGHPLPFGADAVWPCTPWGLPSRASHPARWWALTPPFHPSPVPRRIGAIGWSVLCCTCRRARRGWQARLPVRKHGALRCPDFPPSRQAERAAVRPTHPSS